MQPAECAPAEREIPSAPRERPWLFNFLIAPDAVISIGLVSGALSYLLRNEGVDPARAASIVALLALPHATYFLWGPATDFWMRRRTWLMVAAAAAAALLLWAFHQPRLGAPGAVVLLFLSACCGVFRSRRLRRHDGRAAQRNQSPPRRQLLPEWLAGFRRRRRLLRWSRSRGRLPLGGLGWILAAMIALPSLSALATPAQSRSASKPPAKPPRASGGSSAPPSCAGKPFLTPCSSPFPCAAAP